MRVSNKTIEALVDAITGNGGRTPYRTGSQLVTFFNQFGSKDLYGPGFPSRAKYAEQKLREANGTPALKRIVISALDPRTFMGSGFEVERAVSYLNHHLAYDGYAIMRAGLQHDILGPEGEPADERPVSPTPPVPDPEPWFDRSETLCTDLLDQFIRAFRMLYAVIETIPADKWKTGSSVEFTPAAIAYHSVESLDLYFSGRRRQDFQWGHRFGAPWQEMSRDELPDRQAMTAYLHDVEKRVKAYFADIADSDLGRAFELYDWSGQTLLGHLVYALRHTMHHQGQLAALQFGFGIEGDSWN